MALINLCICFSFSFITTIFVPFCCTVHWSSIVFILRSYTSTKVKPGNTLRCKDPEVLNAFRITNTELEFKPVIEVTLLKVFFFYSVPHQGDEAVLGYRAARQAKVLRDSGRLGEGEAKWQIRLKLPWVTSRVRWNRNVVQK